MSDKVIIRTSGLDKYDLNIEGQGWANSLTLEEVTSMLRERNYSETEISNAVAALEATGTAMIKDAIHVTHREENIRYQDTVTIVDPDAMGDTQRPLTVMLLAESLETDTEGQNDILVVVVWADSDVSVFEKAYSDLAAALQDYNDIVARVKEIYKMLEADSYAEAEEASQELLDDLGLESEEVE